MAMSSNVEFKINKEGVVTMFVYNAEEGEKNR